jgi:hypothetical protein
MNLGIVGSEAAKFTPTTEKLARMEIRKLIRYHEADTIISGACHLGGIDKWAIEEAIKMGREWLEFPPTIQTWEGGYKERNLKIAKASDKVFCITVKDLPKEYSGMRFLHCYHCNTDGHIKSGGCWTVKQAKKMGKETGVIVI